MRRGERGDGCLSGIINNPSGSEVSTHLTDSLIGDFKENEMKVTIRPYRNLATDTLDFYVTKIDDVGKQYAGSIVWRELPPGDSFIPAICLERYATQEFATELVRQGVVDTEVADSERKAMQAHLDDLRQAKKEYAQIISILLDKSK